MTLVHGGPGGGSTPDGFSHEGFFYSTDEEFLAALVPYIREGSGAGEQVMVAVDERKIDLLRDVFGKESAIEYVDMFALGQNPSRIIGAWQDFVDRNVELGRPFRGIGEPVWPGRTTEELAECRNHEDLLNVAFSDSPAWRLLCPYDRASLPEEILEFVEMSHPMVYDAGEVRASQHYRMPEFEELLSDSPLPPPAGRTVKVPFDVGNLRQLREVVTTFAGTSGLGERIDDFVICVNEVATNSVRYGGNSGVSLMWHTERGVVCQISDSGHITDPLVGRTRPSPDAPGGRGLWVANLLCDLVQLRSDEAGTVIRLHMFQ